MTRLRLFTLLFVIVSLKSFSQKPIMLDDIHYYVSDSSVRLTANNYFKKFFAAKAMAEQPMNPLTFIDFLLLRPEQSTINISSPGPFPGIKVGDPKRWMRDKVEPSAKNPPMYGVHWLAISTRNLKKTVKKMLKSGYDFAAENFTLPMEPNTNAVAMFGFDYNIIVIVERPEKAVTPNGIDHLQILVKNLEENLTFYQNVLGAEVLDKKSRSVLLKIGKHKFVLSEPESLGYDREQVISRDPKKFVANIDHRGFLYEDVEPAFYAAQANNCKVVMEPRQMMFYDKPTPYNFCILMSPDGLQIELEEESGRISGRKTYKPEK
jgi:catechol 2,3-dioxygenase-like lactoylglutathione lyase family enzyme